MKDIEEWNRKIIDRIVTTEYPLNPKFHDLSGFTFGRLYVDKYYGKDKDGRIYYWCICKCGNKLLLQGNNLINQSTKSCGCLANEFYNNKELLGSFNRKHGDSNTKLYKTWRGILDRIYNKNSPNYPQYGGRGIKICDEWNNKDTGYGAFKEWSLNNGYCEDVHDLSIDRIDVNGDYCPENCRWTNNLVQQANRTVSAYIHYDRWVYPISIWSRITGIGKTTLKWRRDRGFSGRDIVTIKPTHNMNNSNTERIEINPYIADEFSECNKYNEWVRKGLIEPVKKTDYSKLEIKVNPKFNLRFI